MQNDCWLSWKCKKAKQGCPDFCMKLFRVNKLYEESGISMSQRQHIDLRIDSDGTDREAFIFLKGVENDIENYVNQGKNLYIHSQGYGCGKTSWCLRLVEAYIDKIWYKTELTAKVLFIHVPRFMWALKDAISSPSAYVNHIKENVYKSDIVIFDEIANKAATQYEEEQLLNMINTRLDMGKSSFYTSNVTDSELSEKIGGRLASRILGLSDNITLMGKDKRGLVR